MQKKIFFLACFFINAVCLAQQYPFVQYTPKDGLVNSRVRRIYQDSKSRMYFITYGGLSVYDGARFMNYTRQEGLPMDLVNDVLEISPDSILIATNTTKLNVLVNGKISDYPLEGDSSPLINRFLKSVDGRIYAAGDDGLFVLAPNKFIRLPVTHKNGKDIGFYFNDIIETGNYFLVTTWSDVKEQIILYDRRRQVCTDFYTDARVISIKSGPDGNVWIGTGAGIKRIMADSIASGKLMVTELPASYSIIKELKDQALLLDRSGNVWIYNSNTLRIISADGNQQIISQEHGLKAGYLLDLFQDRERTMWMASDGNGIFKMRGTNVQAMNTLPGNFPLSRSALQAAGDTIWLYNNVDNAICRIYNNKVEKFPFKAGSIYINGANLYVVRGREILVVANKNDAASYRQPKLLVSIPGDSQFGWAIPDPYGGIIVGKTTGNRYSIVAYKKR